MTKLGRPTPGMTQKKLVTHPSTKTRNADVDRYIREHWLTTLVRIFKYDLHCQLSAMSLQAAIPEGDSEEEPLKPTDRQAINHKIKKLQDLKEKSEKLKSSIQEEHAQRFTKKSGKIISGQGFNEKCLGMIAELQSNIDQTLMRAEAQKEKHKRMYPFAKETFVSKKRRVKENKAKARKRRRERAEKNCERVFSAISHSSSYGEVITSDHCSVIGLNSLQKEMVGG